MQTNENVEYSHPSQSPLYDEIKSDRLGRQRLIEDYQNRFSCKLVVMFDSVNRHSIVLFEEAIHGISTDDDLHVMLNSYGGNGEIAVRLVRTAQAKCRELTIIVPDEAKSAATLITLGAHHILMGPASDLGPIDPQIWFPDNEEWVSAKDIIAAFKDCVSRALKEPRAFSWYQSLLGGMDALTFRQARSALDRTYDQLEEALRSNPDRTDDEVKDLNKRLVEPLIKRPRTHSALFDVKTAKESGLPAVNMDVSGEQWQMIWQLWAIYSVLGAPVYEGERVSHAVIPELRRKRIGSPSQIEA